MLFVRHKLIATRLYRFPEPLVFRLREIHGDKHSFLHSSWCKGTFGTLFEELGKMQIIVSVTKKVAPEQTHSLTNSVLYNRPKISFMPCCEFEIALAFYETHENILDSVNFV